MYNVSLRQYKVGRNLDIDESGDLIIAGNRQCFGWAVINVASSIMYLKIYNKATAPDVGTDIPMLTIPLAANGGNSVVEFMGGIEFPLGIGVGATTGVADNNTGAPGANEVVGQILYR